MTYDMEKGKYCKNNHEKASFMKSTAFTAGLLGAAGVLMFFFMPASESPVLLLSLAASFVLFGLFGSFVSWNGQYYMSLSPIFFLGSMLMAGPGAASFVITVGTAVLCMCFFFRPAVVTSLLWMLALFAASGLVLYMLQQLHQTFISFEDPLSLIVTALHLGITTLCSVLLFFLWKKFFDSSWKPVSFVRITFYALVSIPSFVMTLVLFHEELGWYGILFFDILLALLNHFMNRHFHFYHKYQQASYFDALTGLPNARSFESHAFYSKNHKTRYDLYIINIDDFKRLSSFFGQEASDFILTVYTSRLLRRCKPEGEVYRIDGDEFALIAPVKRRAHLQKKLLEDVDEPFLYYHESIYIEVSIGVTEQAADGIKTPEQLLQEAHLSMQHAKETTGSSISLYNNSLAESAINQMKLERDLQQAIQDEALHLIFQPQLSIMDGNLFGFEALLRWEHPEHGNIPPGTFIPIAENSSLIHPLGRWVLKETCRCLRKRQDRGETMYGVCVNVSFRQFLDNHFIDFVIETITAYHIDPRLITLELTESATIESLHELLPKLQKWKQSGIQLALDDFGSGYSSMNHIGTLPFDLIKIDRSFIKDLPDAYSKGAIVRAVVALAHDLNMKVIAEGVETPEQWNWLRSHQCDAAQGFLIGKGAPDISTQVTDIPLHYGN